MDYATGCDAKGRKFESRLGIIKLVTMMGCDIEFVNIYLIYHVTPVLQYSTLVRLLFCINI